MHVLRRDIHLLYTADVPALRDGDTMDRAVLLHGAVGEDDVGVTLPPIAQHDAPF